MQEFYINIIYWLKMCAMPVSACSLDFIRLHEFTMHHLCDYMKYLTIQHKKKVQ